MAYAAGDAGLAEDTAQAVTPTDEPTIPMKTAWFSGIEFKSTAQADGK